MAKRQSLTGVAPLCRAAACFSRCCCSVPTPPHTLLPALWLQSSRQWWLQAFQTFSMEVGVATHPCSWTGWWTQFLLRRTPKPPRSLQGECIPVLKTAWSKQQEQMTSLLSQNTGIRCCSMQCCRGVACQHTTASVCCAAACRGPAQLPLRRTQHNCSHDGDVRGQI